MIEPVLQGFIRSALVSVDLLHMAAFLEKYENCGLTWSRVE
jgi:hypothetical protein